MYRYVSYWAWSVFQI